MLERWIKTVVPFNLKEALELIYRQQKYLADVDASFIRVLPQPGQYTRESIKEAIYYAQCAGIEIYEYQKATADEKFEEAIDIAIFTLNILAYLGVEPIACPVELDVVTCKNPKKVIIDFHKQMSELLYMHVDYKQWKFPQQAQASLSVMAVLALIDLAKTGLALAAYHASLVAHKVNEVNAPELALLNMLQTKMQKSRMRANVERDRHNQAVEFINSCTKGEL